MRTETEKYVSLKNIPKITASTYVKPVIIATDTGIHIRKFQNIKGGNYIYEDNKWVKEDDDFSTGIDSLIKKWTLTDDGKSAFAVELATFVPPTDGGGRKRRRKRKSKRKSKRKTKRKRKSKRKTKRKTKRKRRRRKR